MEDLKHVPFHLPKPSYWPIVLAFSLVLIAIGIIYTLIVSLIGVLLLLGAMIGWVLENRSRYRDIVDQEGEG